MDDSQRGFGIYKNIAIELLDKTIKILNQCSVTHLLISGTLLGYVRHNDFIPWDDDIDLLVDNSIIEKLPTIYEKYGNEISIIYKEHSFIKFFFKNKIIEQKEHEEYLLNKNDKYYWPFVDLFVYKNVNIDKISFFGTNWLKSKFFPLKNVELHNIKVNIPNDANYFLTANYGKKYMTEFIIYPFSHKDEKNIADKKIKL